MSWPYSAAVVHELVKAPKSLAPGQQATFALQGDHGRELTVMLELVDGGLFHLRLIVAAGRSDSPETYEASLLLNNRRIRGVGFSKIERKKYFKTHIPKGWHENVHDYLLPITDPGHNRHDPLPDFTATDLQDFLRKVCTRWNIHLDFDKDLW
jgi:hypothetical protein